MVPLNYFSYFSYLNLTFPFGFQFISLTPKLLLLYSYQFSIPRVLIFLERENAESSPFSLILVYNKFFLLCNIALLLNGVSSWSLGCSENDPEIRLDVSERVSKLISMCKVSTKSVKQEEYLGTINLPFQRINIFLQIFLITSLNLASSHSSFWQNLIIRFLRAITNVSRRPLYLVYCCLVANPLYTLIVLQVYLINLSRRPQQTSYKTIIFLQITDHASSSTVQTIIIFLIPLYIFKIYKINMSFREKPKIISIKAVYPNNSMSLKKKVNTNNSCEIARSSKSQEKSNEKHQRAQIQIAQIKNKLNESLWFSHKNEYSEPIKIRQNKNIKDYISSFYSGNRHQRHNSNNTASINEEQHDLEWKAKSFYIKKVKINHKNYLYKTQKQQTDTTAFSKIKNQSNFREEFRNVMGLTISKDHSIICLDLVPQYCKVQTKYDHIRNNRSLKRKLNEQSNNFPSHIDIKPWEEGKFESQSVDFL